MPKLSSDVARAKLVASSSGGFPFAMAIAALVVIIAASIICSEINCSEDGDTLFALIGGVILLVLALVFMFISSTLSSGLSTIMVLVMFIMWGVYAGVTTFRAPFQVPGNGYFAAWAGFLAATGLLAYSIQEADMLKQRFLSQGVPLCLIIVGSVVVIIDGFAGGCCNADNIIAIVAGTVSLIVTLVRVFFGNAVGTSYFAMFLLGWWLILGLVLTFRVFVIVGNGFFATWVCLMASVALVFPTVVE